MSQIAPAQKFANAFATYKSFTIKSFPLQLVHTGQWKAHVAISWESDGMVNSRSFPVGTDHPTQDEAHLHGITFGQRIIDRKIPDLYID